jgi:hypothetical protein
VGGRTFAGASDFEFLWTSETSPADERFPGWIASYTGPHTRYPSIWIWETMNGLTHNNTQNPLAGIRDPRVPFYFYRQIPAAYTGRGDLTFRVPYRQNGFIGIFVGDNSGFSAASVAGLAPVWGLYPVGGIFDVGQGTAATVARSRDGAVPQKFYTYADMRFNETEMQLVGLMPGNARETFEEAMIATFDHFHKVVDAFRDAAGDSIGQLPDSVRDVYINHVLTLFDDANSEGQMHLVMLQKWIHNVMNGPEAFASVRRTGFPRLFNANLNGGFDPSEGAGGVRPGGMRHPTSNLFPFPTTMPYPQNEVDRNRNINNPPNFPTNPRRPFWMPENINPIQQ